MFGCMSIDLSEKDSTFFRGVGEWMSPGADGCGSSEWIQVFEIRALEVRGRAQSPFRGYFT